MRACSKYKSRDLSRPSVTRSHDRPGQIQTQHRAMPFDSFVDLLRFIYLLFGRMLRLAFVRTFHFAHPSHHYHRHPIRIFSNMATESTGTHKDPVTGEMISKQCVLIPTNCRPFFSPVSPVSTGNSSVAKSNAKKRQGRRRLPRISLLPSLTLRTM